MLMPCQRWIVALITGLVLGSTLGVTPGRAQAVPIIVPPVVPVIVGLPSGGGRVGVTWSTSGRADVDVHVDRSQRHGRAMTR
jgi:hypothetical protein